MVVGCHTVRGCDRSDGRGWWGRRSDAAAVGGVVCEPNEGCLAGRRALETPIAVEATGVRVDVEVGDGGELAVVRLGEEGLGVREPLSLALWVQGVFGRTKLG